MVDIFKNKTKKKKKFLTHGFGCSIDFCKLTHFRTAEITGFSFGSLMDIDKLTRRLVAPRHHHGFGSLMDIDKLTLR